MDMEGVRPGISGSVCVLRDVSLSTLVFPHAFQLLSVWTRWCRRVLERVCHVLLLLIAPRWPGRVWFPDIISLLDGPPPELPVRRNLPSQAGSSIFHPQPELWKTVGLASEGALRPLYQELLSKRFVVQQVGPHRTHSSDFILWTWTLPQLPKCSRPSCCSLDFNTGQALVAMVVLY